MKNKDRIRTYRIYKISSPCGRVYVGCTYQLLCVRRAKLYYDTRNKKKKKAPIFEALRQYPEDQFKWELLDEFQGNREEADKREVYWIRHYEATNPEKGLNLRSWGILRVWTDEEKKAFSDYMKNVIATRGAARTAQWKLNHKRGIRKFRESPKEKERAKKIATYMRERWKDKKFRQAQAIAVSKGLKEHYANKRKREPT